MKINVFTPYGLDESLANAYNHCMEESSTEWVLLLDHDVFLACNPYWYQHCLRCIDNVSDRVGMLTAVTYERNGFDLYAKKTDNINKHIDYANMLWNKHAYAMENVENHRRPGFFMLVRKKAWEQIPFIDQGKGVNKIDHNFCRRLIQSGWQIKIMKGLYIYHKTGVRKL